MLWKYPQSAVSTFQIVLSHIAVDTAGLQNLGRNIEQREHCVMRTHFKTGIRWQDYICDSWSQSHGSHGFQAAQAILQGMALCFWAATVQMQDAARSPHKYRQCYLRHLAAPDNCYSSDLLNVVKLMSRSSADLALLLTKATC